MNHSKEIAKALIEINAVKFNLDQPIRFKSGILSPIYIDNRTFPFHPHAWSLVIMGFEELIEEKQLDYQVIAGIETAGIPHSAALGYALVKPSVFVRKKTKDHGTKKLVEGGDVSNKTVLLLEDHISTGLSSLTGVENLRDEGAIINDCICITSYGFKQAIDGFAKAKVNLHSLTNFDDIFEAAVGSQILDETQVKALESWLDDPQKWTDEHAKD